MISIIIVNDIILYIEAAADVPSRRRRSDGRSSIQIGRRVLNTRSGDGDDNCFDDWCCVVNPDGSYYYMDRHYAPAPDYLLSYDADGRLVLLKQEKPT